jgi:hypothetical protein
MTIETSLRQFQSEELRHANVMREWQARERDRKEWAWEQRQIEDERRETDRIIHERHMERWAPAYQAWKIAKSGLSVAVFVALFWFAVLLAGVGANVQKAECLRDIAACEIAVKGGAK